VEAFFGSTMVVGLAGLGDKTQILSMVFAARFHRPIPMIFGIFFATLANHAAEGDQDHRGHRLRPPWAPTLGVGR
jgi:Ca2+/H+ antiporter, TMEM165/GDT1 family